MGRRKRRKQKKQAKSSSLRNEKTVQGAYSKKKIREQLKDGTYLGEDQEADRLKQAAEELQLLGDFLESKPPSVERAVVKALDKQDKKETKRVFKNGMPRLPGNLWPGVEAAFKLTSSGFDEIVRATTWHQHVEASRGYGLDPAGVEKHFISSKQSAASNLSGIQQFHLHGERLVLVDEDSLSSAENTDCLSTILGNDFKISHPCFGFWLPRNPKPYPNTRSGEETKTNFVVLQFIENETGEDSVGFEYSLADESSPRRVEFTQGPDSGEVLAALGVLVFLNEDPNWTNDFSAEGPTYSYVLPIMKDKTLLESYTSGKGMTESTRRLWKEGARPTTRIEESQLSSLQFMNIISGLVSMMAYYPEYVSTTSVNVRHPSKNPKKKKKGKVASLSVMSLKQKVREDGSDSGSGASATNTGKGPRREHWRRGHWRRQFHGESWRRRNPDTPVKLADDREYHMQWIRPMLVSKNEVLHKS